MAAWRSTSEWKAPRLQAAAGQRGEEGLDGVQPGAGGRREVEGPARVPGEPGADLGVLVGGVVVEDGVDQLAGRHRGLDPIEEADELLVPVPRHALADDAAVEHVQRCEQGGRAMSDVVMMGCTSPAPVASAAVSWWRKRRQPGDPAHERDHDRPRPC